MARPPKVVSLFTGAGGMDLGLEAAGFQMGVAVEMNAEAVVTLRANRDWHVLERDIHSVPSDELRREAGAAAGEVDLLVGGPPCQPFSKSGYWHSGDAKRLDDPRATTMHAYLRVLRDLQPAAFLLENVPGLAFSDKDEGLVLIRRTVDEINAEAGTSYRMVAAQLNAASYGVPQTRERVFVIGHREGKEFEFPRPTHALPPRGNTGAEVEQQVLDLGDLEPPRTAWDAIGHLEQDDDPELRVRGKWGKLLPTIPEGQNYLFHTERGAGLPIFGWRRRYWSMLLKLAKDRPSWTLTAQPGPAIGPFHWKSRRLSAAELCALQTFPRDYRVLGGVLAAHRQVGNAVPSALAEILGLEIRRQLLGGDAVGAHQVSLLPTRAFRTPPPEPVRAVADPGYLKLVGEHEAHPGTGRGPGARARRRIRQQESELLSAEAL